ncbi:MAG TPA: hypothetical protein VMK12_25495 [Anaeromyxobacteraceae bacterium]|nr:hypothetical protein [Anaeromyxobacteraceae bacterium]
MQIKASVTPPVGERRIYANLRAGLLFLTAALIGCGGAEDDPVTSIAPSSEAIEAEAPNLRANTPASVPVNYIATPHGYFHPSCVLELGDDEWIGNDGDVARIDGNKRAIGACRHPRYNRHGWLIRQDKDGQTVPPPTVNGWLGSVSSTSAGPVKSISATWHVPHAPRVVASQTLYFFSGLEPAATGDTILQPVLAWNGFYDRRWTIASWNCCKGGNALHSNPKAVATGDMITGTVEGAGCNVAGACSSWTVRTASSGGTSTTLRTTSYGEVLDWEFGGVLEAYGLAACNQYPPDDGIVFSTIGTRLATGAVAQPAWLSSMTDGESPGCLTSVSADPGGTSVRLAWMVR